MANLYNKTALGPHIQSPPLSRRAAATAQPGATTAPAVARAFPCGLGGVDTAVLYRDPAAVLTSTPLRPIRAAAAPAAARATAFSDPGRPARPPPALTRPWNRAPLFSCPAMMRAIWLSVTPASARAAGLLLGRDMVSALASAGMLSRKPVRLFRAPFAAARQALCRGDPAAGSEATDCVRPEAGGGAAAAVDTAPNARTVFRRAPSQESSLRRTVCLRVISTRTVTIGHILQCLTADATPF